MRRLALVTGASSGIGAALARHLAATDHEVLLGYRTNEGAAQDLCTTIRRSGGIAQPIALDVRSETSVQRASAHVSAHYDRLDTLICNAGIDQEGNLEHCSFETWRDIIGVKLDGGFLCCKHFLPLLKRSRSPNIIFIGSGVAARVDPSDIAYSVASRALEALAQTLAVDLARYGVRTNVVSPGSIATNLAFWRHQPTDVWETIRSNNPLQQLCRFEDINAAVAFILSEQAKFINGAVVHVDGGRHVPVL